MQLILTLDLEFSQHWEKLADWEKESLLRIAKIYLRVRRLRRQKNNECDKLELEAAGVNVIR